MPEPRTIDDLTTEELREWIADWLVNEDHENGTMDALVVDLWLDEVDPSGSRMYGAWLDLRDELLAAYAERAK